MQKMHARIIRSELSEAVSYTHLKGNEYALVEGTQYQIYQDHTEQEYHRGIVGGLAFLARQSSVLVAASGR